LGGSGSDPDKRSKDHRVKQWLWGLTPTKNPPAGAGGFLKERMV